MLCRLVKFLLPLYAGGDLPDWLQKWTSLHLSGCERCANDLQKLASAQRQVRHLAARQKSLPLSVDFAARVRAQAEGAGKTRSEFPVRWVAAALLVLAGMGWLVRSFEPVEVVQAPVAAPETIVEEEAFTEGDLEGLMSLFNPNRELTDAELDAKYPVVEEVDYPRGVKVVYHTNDPGTKIVWVLPQEGGNVR